jgi:hypothetical protein
MIDLLDRTVTWLEAHPVMTIVALLVFIAVVMSLLSGCDN